MGSEFRRRGETKRLSHCETSEPPNLTFQYLNEITNGFSDEQEIGRGGFGVVYKGIKEDGEIIAVKKLRCMFDDKEFMNEVNHLKMLKHRNIVRFKGYCNEKEETHVQHNGELILAKEPHMLLCMEYLSKGSLDKYLADKSCVLNLDDQFEIIKDVCHGLHYLLSQDIPVIHLDLKPANILLNDNLVSKITDFGLSRLLDQQESIQTSKLNGTLGYMPPEYVNGGKITRKSDIFSLGVIILEIIMGNREYPDVSETPSDDMIESEFQKWRKNVPKNEFWDPSFQINCKRIKRCFRIGLYCVNRERNNRPTTAEVIEMLHGFGSETITNPELIAVAPHKLPFCLELNKLRCVVHLKNRTDRHVGFRLEVNNRYKIEPDIGFLCPKSKTTVLVTVEKRSALSLDMPLQCNDQIIVESVLLRTSKDKYLPEMFTKHKPASSNIGQEVKLTVIYEPPAGQAETNASYRLQYEGFLDDKNMDSLIWCIRQDMGFQNGRPVAACIIYRCLLQWKSFEARRTDHFSRILVIMQSGTKEQGSNGLAYWLSNAFTLLQFVRETFETEEATRFSSLRLKNVVIRRILAELSRNQAFRGNNLIEGFPKVEAKRPAQFFKEHLTTFVSKVYALIRDNLIEEMSKLSNCCIQAPTMSQAHIDHWLTMERILTQYSDILRSNYVPSFLISKLFTEVFSFINTRLFNTLLVLKPKYCSSETGKYIKAGLVKFEQWCTSETEEYAGSSWENLRHIREAVQFLIVGRKENKTLEEVTKNLCPVLSIQQLYHIVKQHSENKYDKNKISPVVLSSLGTMEDSKNASIESLLLVETTRSKLRVDDIPMALARFEDTNLQWPSFTRMAEANDKELKALLPFLTAFTCPPC